MIVVGYYTTDDIYQDHVNLLNRSLEQFSIKSDFLAIDPADWLKATAYKPTAVKTLMDKHETSVLYLDVDSVIHENVEHYFSSLDVDIAFHYKDGHELISSTVYFKYSPRVLQLLDRWKQEMVRTPEVWDQKVLQNLVESQEFSDLKVKRLDPTFTYIFDLTKETHPELSPKVEQLQASREQRHLKKMRTLKSRLLAKIGIKPKSYFRLKARRERLQELSEKFNVSFTFPYDIK